MGCFDDVVLDPQIFEEKLDRKIVVGLDSPNLRGGHHDDRRPLLVEKAPDRVAFLEIKFAARSGEEMIVAFRRKFAGNGAPGEPPMSRDIYRFTFMHFW